jgi:hypothetical protein
MKALSIKQPWAWLIVHGFKDIENRGWATRFRGSVLIHAGKSWDRDAEDDMVHGRDPTGSFERNKTMIERFVAEYQEVEAHRGGIVGVAEIVDCVTESSSPWFFGDFGFVIRNARPLPFRPCRGMLGFFDPDFTPPRPKPAKIVPPARQPVLF